MNGEDKQEKGEFRAAVTMTVFWVAGLTLGIIFLALFSGILLDKLLETKPLFTILLMVASIPLTIYLTLRVVKTATKKITKTATQKQVEEDSHRGETN